MLQDLLFSLNYTDADFDAVAGRFVAAAKAMDRDGWWWADARATNKAIRRGILREVAMHRLLGRRRAAAGAQPSRLPARTRWAGLQTRD